MINLLHVNINSILIGQIQFQIQKNYEMSYFDTFMNHNNIWIIWKTVGFIYLLIYSICCDITHYKTSGKLQCVLMGAQELKRQMMTS